MERCDQPIAIDDNVGRSGVVIHQAADQVSVKCSKCIFALYPFFSSHRINDLGIVSKQLKNTVHISVGHSLKIRSCGGFHLLLGWRSYHRASLLFAILFFGMEQRGNHDAYIKLCTTQYDTSLPTG